MEHKTEQDDSTRGWRYLLDSAACAIFVFLCIRACVGDLWAGEYRVQPDQEFQISWTQEGSVDGWTVEAAGVDGLYVGIGDVGGTTGPMLSRHLGTATVEVYRIRAYREALGGRLYSDYSDPSDPVIATTAPVRPCGVMVTVP